MKRHKAERIVKPRRVRHDQSKQVHDCWMYLVCVAPSGFACHPNLLHASATLRLHLVQHEHNFNTASLCQTQTIKCTVVTSLFSITVCKRKGNWMLYCDTVIVVMRYLMQQSGTCCVLFAGKDTVEEANTSAEQGSVMCTVRIVTTSHIKCISAEALSMI